MSTAGLPLDNSHPGAGGNRNNRSRVTFICQRFHGLTASPPRPRPGELVGDRSRQAWNRAEIIHGYHGVMTHSSGTRRGCVIVTQATLHPWHARPPPRLREACGLRRLRLVSGTTALPGRLPAEIYCDTSRRLRPLLRGRKTRTVLRPAVLTQLRTRPTWRGRHPRTQQHPRGAAAPGRAGAGRPRPDRARATAHRPQAGACRRGSAASRQTKCGPRPAAGAGATQPASAAPPRPRPQSACTPPRTQLPHGTRSGRARRWPSAQSRWSTSPPRAGASGRGGAGPRHWPRPSPLASLSRRMPKTA